jgi:hypothetical protein
MDLKICTLAKPVTVTADKICRFSQKISSVTSISGAGETGAGGTHVRQAEEVLRGALRSSPPGHLRLSRQGGAPGASWDCVMRCLGPFFLHAWQGLYLVRRLSNFLMLRFLFFCYFNSSSA